ncbi:hypothetical protein MPTK1_5g13730 [Marchantia polymorpha subsp. ruderalis]|uniref:RING-type domain-containing protein n=2 Tax=Marchantia polymorpha TaxID=3197 RepID=A0AAF6BI21_MARPO|nr:hypothetical protein MARPO_0032s0063 [Marchantia polymorpha]BBN11655.1 hypothetical protein Mp_5g13730 [Marchantia polymorpha subsp. ruderalis]|eukprot:PTQ41869.1 hypothetical protein MARPO_0032s0063 [Marchantia polymorpha]
MSSQARDACGSAKRRLPDIEDIASNANRRTRTLEDEASLAQGAGKEDVNAKAPPHEQKRGGSVSMHPDIMHGDHSEKEKAFMAALSELKTREVDWALCLTNIIKVDREIQTREAELFGALTALERAKADSNLRLTRHEERLTTLRLKREAMEKDLAEIRSERRCQQDVRVKELERTSDAHFARILELEAKLESSERSAAQDLEAEREKRICRICMSNSRNALVLPCMHFLYCTDCLHTHQKTCKECPTCRGPISALIHCKLNLDD